MLFPFALDRRDGDALLEAEAVKEIILVDVETNSVSIPSALLCEAGGDGLFAMRAGSVNERRMLEFEAADGAWGAAMAGAWVDMVRGSRRHFSA